MNLPNINFCEDWDIELESKICRDGPWSSMQMYTLSNLSTASECIDHFYGLNCLKYISNFNPLPHQIETANKVINEMNGRAILADEVGLGKTVEAGLILKEYLIRGLVKKVLILVPASLVNQWASELLNKFSISAAIFGKGVDWGNTEIIITSIDMAKRKANSDEVLSQHYDLIIVDEAHKLKNFKTKNYQLIQKINKRFCLYLTATPIQNNLEEIFYLVSLLKPGHLGSYEDFKSRFNSKSRLSKDDIALKNLISEVMIRNRREDTNINWTARNVETIFVNLSPTERSLYDAISNTKFEGSSGNGFSKLLLQREACSSREAVYFTLKNKQYDKLLSYVENVDINSKAIKAVELIKGTDDKFIIFTEYRATQLFLQWFLKQNGITSVPFRGGYKRSKKEYMCMLFEHRAQVMIATEAGGEGLNLQFCHKMINFDLPWNPMRLEQRIGRIHRFGQEENVSIINFVTRNTIEEHIMKILYEKIKLFERVIGELDEILLKLEISNLEKHLTDILKNSKTVGEMELKINNFNEVVNFAQQLKNQKLVGYYESS